MIVQRDLANILKKFVRRKEYLAITGPRQAGKTTCLEIIEDFLLHDLKIHKDSMRILTFEDRKLLSQFESDPVSFVRSYMPAKTSRTFYLMIDEFQYAEEGGQRLKLLYDIMPKLKIMALRVIEWVILYLLEHTCKYFQAQILLVSETVSPSLYNTNFV
ncbi:MAG: AAA family ATPase, partial [Nitrospirota bacterium]